MFIKFVASYALTFVMLFLLFGFARLVAMIVHKLMPAGKWKDRLFLDTGPL